MKLRFPSRLNGEALRALGAAPVGMPVPQIPEAMTQGVIDGAVVPWEVVPSIRLQEMAKFHTEIPGSPTLYIATFILAMNKAKYEGLAPELRAVLDANSGAAAARMAAVPWDERGPIVEAEAKKRGNTDHHHDRRPRRPAGSRRPTRWSRPGWPGRRRRASTARRCWPRPARWWPSTAPASPECPTSPAPPRGPVARLATGLALAGGATLLATALLTTYSVVQRWITRQPVPGDFELVSLGAGLSVMGFLAYGTLMRSNILVDSFSSWLPRRVNEVDRRLLDAGLGGGRGGAGGTPVRRRAGDAGGPAPRRWCSACRPGGRSGSARWPSRRRRWRRCTGQLRFAAGARLMAPEFLQAALGFAALLGLIALRCPVGLAMLLVGAGGYSVHRRPGDPAELPEDDALAPLRQLHPLGHPAVHPDGRVRRARRAGARPVPRRQCADRPPARAAWRWRRSAPAPASARSAAASLATAATFGRAALPELRRYGYDAAPLDRHARGRRHARHPDPALVILVIYAIITEQNIAKLFMAALIPGLLATLFYMLAIAVHRRGCGRR